LKPAVEAASNYAIGVGYSMAEEGRNIGNFWSRIATLGKYGLPETPESQKPRGAMQKAGAFTQQAAEYAIPLGEEKLVAGIASKGLKLLSEAGINAARTGLTTAAHSGTAGESTGAAATAGGMSLLFGALAPLVAKAGRGIQKSTLRPRKVDFENGFKWGTLDKFKLKGDLGQSFEQVDKELTRLRTERNAMLAPGKVKADIAPIFESAIAEAKKKAAALKYGPLGGDVTRQFENMRDDVYSLLGVPTGARTAVVDIRVAENLKEFLGTMGAWSYGSADRSAKVSEMVANDLYKGAKTSIEKALGSAGLRVRELNRQMQDLIPVKNAMLARIPVDARQTTITLSDLAATMPAILTGEPMALTIEGLNRAQKNLRFGSWLVRNAGTGAKTGAASRLVGGAAANVGTRKTDSKEGVFSPAPTL
jgi:hypothetical protein